ncbi:Uu.00g103190.m01.CDS01 [Anthostomella pinea]|uniref:Uu.00g103190.m01.CDS01 n=1 Tax=Anthostomella pinea TaxID=933095 RepID=A0AAI8VDJ8_9PEZI|nr:Uu.00g103190.m01.CDS01 [Anthostomella pinea]
MGFTGPGVYEIVPYQAPTLSANSWEGLMSSGAVVKTYTRDRTNPSTNTLWQLALVDGPWVEPVYLIINVRTGYFLTATADNTITSTPQVSPSDPSCQWIMKSAPTNGYDTFTINSKIASRGQLNVKGSSTSSGADILSWPIENGDNSKWYLDPR